MARVMRRLSSRPHISRSAKDDQTCGCGPAMRSRDPSPQEKFRFYACSPPLCGASARRVPLSRRKAILRCCSRWLQIETLRQPSFRRQEAPQSLSLSDRLRPLNSPRSSLYPRRQNALRSRADEISIVCSTRGRSSLPRRIVSRGSVSVLAKMSADFVRFKLRWRSMESPLQPTGTIRKGSRRIEAKEISLSHCSMEWRVETGTGESLYPLAMHYLTWLRPYFKAAALQDGLKQCPKSGRPACSAGPGGMWVITVRVMKTDT